MKSLSNQATSLINAGEPVTHFDLVGAVLNNPATTQGGAFDPKTMRIRLKILDKLAEATGGDEAQAALEDAEYNELQAAVAKHNWPTMHPDLLAFSDSFQAS